MVVHGIDQNHKEENVITKVPIHQLKFQQLENQLKNQLFHNQQYNQLYKKFVLISIPNFTVVEKITMMVNLLNVSITKLLEVNAGKFFFCYQC
jgi:hypothetical protein